VDVIPEGDLLIIEGEDRVGVVGEIGTILSAEGINIAQFHLGRRDGQAICTVTLDSPADEAVLAKIEAVPYILSVRSVRLGPGGA
jgi:D-3-phosphoglycerate dehydrogenase / 2-oxoglutarate reductase